MTDIKKIGILTSGGDCAGLNAIIRAVVSHAILTYGWEVYGIAKGTQGLLARPVEAKKLSLEMFNGNVLRQGGTILGTTNKGNPFNYPMPDGSFKDRSDDIIDGFKSLGLDALITIGGDGSMAILQKLAQKGGIKMIGIPKTIDNDIGLTENAVGFDTAVAVATEALDRLQPTAASHDRVMVLEVMGRDAGHIALEAGIAGGADVILIPEIPYDIKKVAAHIQKIQTDYKRNFALVIVSEAIKDVEGTESQKEYANGEKRFLGIGHHIGDHIADLTGAETRVTVLGHVQRGSQPSPHDRLLASAFGVHAVDLIAEGKEDRMVVWRSRQICDVAIEDVIQNYQDVDPNGPMVHTARGLGICLGD